jgi:hypothetical protein
VDVATILASQEEASMSAKLIWVVGLTAGIFGAAGGQGLGGEEKVKIEQTPPPVQQTIKTELVGARLEDIARKQRDGKTFYETDIIKNGRKWEVVIAEDGHVVSRRQEGHADEPSTGKSESDAATGAAWRESFPVRKSDLSPTGSNPWLTIQPGACSA